MLSLKVYYQNKMVGVVSEVHNSDFFAFLDMMMDLLKKELNYVLY